MIAAALRIQIERYAAEMVCANPLYYLAADGELTPTQLTRYLKNVRYLLGHTPAHLTRARLRALEIRDADLAHHYAHKLAEEVGHELWADRDLQRVGATLPAGPAVEVVPAMRELVTFVESMIEEDPALYLSYILFAEYLIVLLGPQWLTLIEERCGVPRTSMTVIGNHAELDRAHAEEAFEQIDQLVGDPKKLPRMREVLAQSIRIFARFSEQVTGIERSARDASHRLDLAEQPAA